MTAPLRRTQRRLEAAVDRLVLFLAWVRVLSRAGRGARLREAWRLSRP